MSIDALFDFVCARDPGRTLSFQGEPLVVCQRCLGIYAGIVAGVISAGSMPRRTERWSVPLHVALIAQIVPLGWLGLPLDPWGRYLSGALFGLGVGRLAYPALRRGRRGTGMRALVAFVVLAAPPLLARLSNPGSWLNLIATIGATTLAGLVTLFVVDLTHNRTATT